MGSFLGSIMGSAGVKLNDRVIANNSLISLKGAATAYLWAALESATPEIRRMWSEYLNQTLIAHEALTALSIKKGWYLPYQAPEDQLTQVFKESEWVLDTH